MATNLTRPNEDSVGTGPITVLRTQLEQRAAEFEMVLPSHISPERFQRTVLTAAQGNADLLTCDRRSFLTACMKAAQDGLLPDGREAALVKYNTRMKIDGEWKYVPLVQYLPMVYGIRKKILQSGEITDIFAAVVYRQEVEAGRFIYEEGTERCLRHKPILDHDFRPTDADIVLAYSLATFNNGFKSFEIMRRYEIDEVRESSQTGATTDHKGDPRDAKGPWVDWFSEMAKKSVMRRHSKSLPQSGDIVRDVEAEDMAFAARSAVALLDSAKGATPTPAMPDEPFDPETGEVETPMQDNQIATDVEPEPEPEPEPKKESKPRRTVETKSEQPKREVEIASEQPEPEAMPPAAVEDERDELGITVPDEERRAKDYIARANDCETIIDFKKLEREANTDLAEMPLHIAQVVDAAFDVARERLAPGRPKK